jgi:hypothetical protein
MKQHLPNAICEKDQRVDGRKEEKRRGLKRHKSVFIEETRKLYLVGGMDDAMHISQNIVEFDLSSAVLKSYGPSDNAEWLATLPLKAVPFTTVPLATLPLVTLSSGAEKLATTLASKPLASKPLATLPLMFVHPPPPGWGGVDPTIYYYPKTPKRPNPNPSLTPNPTLTLTPPSP